MTTWNPRANDLFLQVLELRSPGERRELLDRACAGDTALRAEVEALLEASDKAGSFLRFPAPQLGAIIDAPAPAERPGTVIGPYKLLQQIGEGGMGTVFMAEQTSPVQRKVALKVIKRGMDSSQVIARFEAERQALAMMDHVNIARVLDAGTTEAGRPYFVMELVHGMPITKYCDDHRLSPRERLELFVPVCHAIQHAHQKGIIHRDIKPSNVMITLYDGKPVAKVIDFGVAKATEQKLTERTLFTQFGAMVGTLEYMSPEQAEMSALGIDTRSDIYSLGVLLYELLTGGTPLPHKRLKEAAHAEILRMIREEEPPKPSTRLSDSGEALASISANRHMEPAKLTKLVRGELDWIVMKCLEKDRNRRYETANGFAMDVQRYLADEPVQACPPSAGYRLQKFVRRNRAPVLAAGLLLIALIAGVIGTSIGMTKAQRSEKAESVALRIALDEKAKAQAAAEAEKKANAQAQVRLRQVEQGSEILASVFRDLDPMAEEKEGKPLRAILGDRLAHAAEQLDGEAVGDPLLVASLQNRLGRSLINLGMADRAIPLLAKARATRATSLGADHPDTLTSMNTLAEGYCEAGNVDLALPLWEETLELLTAKLSAEHHDTLRCMHNLSMGYYRVGKRDLARPLLEKTLGLMKANLGADNPDTLRCMSDLAGCYQDAAKLDLALPLLQEALELMKAKLGAEHLDTLGGMVNLALGYAAVGELDQALPLLEEALRLRKAKLGADHPHTLISMNFLADGYRCAGKLDLALPILEETLELTKAKLGADHPDTLTSMHNLALGYYVAGNLDQALPLLEETLELRRAKLGDDHPYTLSSMANLANGYRVVGRLPEALPLLLEAAAGIEKRRFEHEDATRIIDDLIRCHERLRQFNQAEAWRRKWLAVMKERAGADSLPDAGNPDQAPPLLKQTFELTKAKLGFDHPDTLRSMGNLAARYQAAGKPDLALPLLEEALVLQKAKLGADHPSALICMGNLATAYYLADKLDQALPLWEEAVALQRAKLGAEHSETLTSVCNLACGYQAAGRSDQALQLFQEVMAIVERRRYQHENAGWIVNNLIDCHERRMQFDQAEAWRRKWMAVIKERAGADSMPYAGELSKLGSSLTQQKKWTDAELVLRECLAVCENQAPDDWRTFNTQSMLGGALLGQQRYSDAEPLLLAGHEGMKQREYQIPPQGQHRIPAAIERLVQLYEATGKPEEAARWQNELEKQKSPPPAKL